MESHKDLKLSSLREMIIRYGAKYMERYESDLYYDCEAVEHIVPGQTVFWFVSATHAYLYTVQEIREKHLDLNTLYGNRFNYLIHCKENESGTRVFDMHRVFAKSQVQTAVNECEV